MPAETFMFRRIGIPLLLLAFAIPCNGEGYHLGLDFLDSPMLFDGQYNVEMLYPYSLTEPSGDPNDPNGFVAAGALDGFTEQQARRAVALYVDAAFRRIDTGDPATTVAVGIYNGTVPFSAGGRRLNLAVGKGIDYNPAYGMTDGIGVMFDDSEHPNDAYAGIVYLDNIAKLEGVAYSTSAEVFTAISRTACHESGHLFGLDHLLPGQAPPHAAMATGSTGLTSIQRIEIHAFSADGAEHGFQDGGLTSQQYLVAVTGTVARGDFDLDGDVDLDDAGVLTGNWQSGDRLFYEGDTNGDHRVDIDDAAMLIGNFGSSYDVAAGEADLTFDEGTGQLTIEANEIAWLKLEVIDGGQLAENGYTQIFQFSTVQQPDAGNGYEAGEFTTGNFITGTGTADLAVVDGVAILSYKVLGGETQTVEVVIPEPATMSLLALGGIAAVIRRRRRQPHRKAFGPELVEGS